MKKEHRLRRSLDFRRAFKEGKRFSSPHFVLYMHKNSLLTTRVGISISKGHFRLATRRNRLRRIAKELLRKKIIPFFKGYDFVIASRENFSKSNMDGVEKELKHLISRLNSQ